MTTTTIAIPVCTESKYDDELSWREALVLKAAAQVDYVPFRPFLDEEPGMIRHQVYLSLVHRGLLGHHPYGFEITNEGRLEASIINRMEADR